MSRTVVADAGPLIAFGRAGRLDLPAAVLGEVQVPEAVLAECLSDVARPGALAIRDAAAQGLLVRVADPDPPCPALPLLDKGESAAIRLALERSVPVLMDEKSGRRVASDLGVREIGSAGVLLAAKKLGLIDSVAPLLESFARQGYHLSQALMQAVLERAQELEACDGGDSSMPRSRRPSHASESYQRHPGLTAPCGASHTLRGTVLLTPSRGSHDDLGSDAEPARPVVAGGATRGTAFRGGHQPPDRGGRTPRGRQATARCDGAAARGQRAPRSPTRRSPKKWRPFGPREGRPVRLVAEIRAGEASLGS